MNSPISVLPPESVAVIVNVYTPSGRELSRNCATVAVKVRFGAVNENPLQRESKDAPPGPTTPVQAYAIAGAQLAGAISKGLSTKFYGMPVYSSVKSYWLVASNVVRLSHGVSTFSVKGHEKLNGSVFEPVTVTVYSDNPGLAAVPNSKAGVKLVSQKISSEGPDPV